MDKLKILSGNACFLVKNTSDTMSRKDFEGYLKGEGFAEFRKYGWKDRGCFYINVNSMRFSAGVSKPAKLAQTIVGEGIKNPFTIDEFRAIWNILKTHIGDLDQRDEITKGCSLFLVCDEMLNESSNEFIDYLDGENFNALSDDSYGGRGIVAVNVKSMIYSKGRMADVMASTFVGDSSTCALSVDEFRTVWDIIKKHREDCSLEALLRQCEEFDDLYKVIECCDRVFEIEPGNIQALYYKALALFDLKKYDEALDLAERAIRIHPEDYRFHNIRAFIFTDIYRFSEAIESYNSSFRLGGFDAEDSESTYQYRAICHLRKAREDFYVRNNPNEALKSLNTYLNWFPDDNDVLRLRDDISRGNARLDEKLKYLEFKAYELYSLGYLRESFEAYGEVFKASQDLKRGIDRTSYNWWNPVFGRMERLDNFRWYDEVLSMCLLEFNGSYEEFFEGLFEISEETISACVDRAKFLSKVYGEDLCVEYSKKLVDACPSSREARSYFDEVSSEIGIRSHLAECAVFRDYESIDEYVDDVIFCLMHSCRYSEEAAKNFTEIKRDEIERCYERKCPADDLAMDYYHLCG